MRLDKWIWSVCLVKNRTLSTLLCRQGKVLVNGAEGKAAKSIKVGDIIELKSNRYVRVKVVQFAAKPIKKELAPIDFYEDQTPEEEPALDMNGDVNGPSNNKFRNFKYQTKKDGRVSKKDKRARQNAKGWDL